MTQQKHLKARVRERMAKTGESYATARRQVLKSAPPDHSHSLPYLHFSGSVPAATSLRILLANHGVSAPHTGRPFSEAMVFGIAGGVGAGVYAARYEKDDVSTFFIAGRHSWFDDEQYLTQAASRFGATVDIRETGGAQKAKVDLDDLSASGKPIIAWVDQATLPYRNMPSLWEGGGYHVLVVYEMVEESEEVVLGDLAPAPITVSYQDLSAARSRIKKQKNRLMALSRLEPPDLMDLVLGGLKSCGEGLTKGRSTFTLEAFAKLVGDLGSSSKDGWFRKFPRGHNLWRGLTSIYDFIEHYGTGGGLSRPIFADFLWEAGEALGLDGVEAVAQAYDDLGKGWSELAQIALPETDPFDRARRLMDRKAEQFMEQGAAGSEGYGKVWKELQSLEEEVGEDFPLSEDEVGDLLSVLAEKASDLYRGEVEALAALDQLVQKLSSD